MTLNLRKVCCLLHYASTMGVKQLFINNCLETSSSIRDNLMEEQENCRVCKTEIADAYRCTLCESHICSDCVVYSEENRGFICDICFLDTSEEESDSDEGRLHDSEEDDGRCVTDDNSVINLCRKKIGKECSWPGHCKTRCHRCDCKSHKKYMCSQSCSYYFCRDCLMNDGWKDRHMNEEFICRSCYPSFQRSMHMQADDCMIQ